MKKNTDTSTPTTGAPDGEFGAADLPTQGGLYEFDRATKSMRQVDGDPQADEAGTHGETTGEQA